MRRSPLPEFSHAAGPKCGGDWDDIQSWQAWHASWISRQDGRQGCGRTEGQGDKKESRTGEDAGGWRGIDGIDDLQHRLPRCQPIAWLPLPLNHQCSQADPSNQRTQKGAATPVPAAHHQTLRLLASAKGGARWRYSVGRHASHRVPGQEPSKSQSISRRRPMCAAPAPPDWPPSTQRQLACPSAASQQPLYTQLPASPASLALHAVRLPTFVSVLAFRISITARFGSADTMRFI
jgi:hypothetical protein